MTGAVFMERIGGAVASGDGDDVGLDRAATAHGVRPDVGRLPERKTVADLARQIHRDLADTMKFARLWGHGRFEGQQVHKTEKLQDRDIVEIHE